MNHHKTSFTYTYTINGEEIVVEGPVERNVIESYLFHEDLDAFRIPSLQHIAIAEIAELKEGRIIIARIKNKIIGYVTFLFPDPLERWYEAKNDYIMELGAIEVASPYRKMKVASTLLKVSFLDPFMENYIVFTTEYYWHWDLKRTGLNIWEYRKAMEQLMTNEGLIWMATDDPEICAHPVNCLMVRIGKNVSPNIIEAFDHIRMKGRFMY